MYTHNYWLERKHYILKFDVKTWFDLGQLKKKKKS